ncbi:MAG: geranylgeranylglyceryl/heptaprenylglyceryl phosphate synthase [Candidatus Aenigmatarchaeota archaeon]
MDNILKWIEENRERPLFLSFIDLGLENGHFVTEMAKKAEKGGSDGIVVGGSLNINEESVEEMVSKIKKMTDLPVLIFPGNTGMVSGSADGIFFQTLVNSRNPYWITGAQAMSAPAVHQSGVEVISTAYIVVEPGGVSSWVGEANPLPRENRGLLKAYATFSELSGKDVICIDTGFGVKTDLPVEMIRTLKKIVDIPLLFNGKINDIEDIERLKETYVDAVITRVENKSSEEIKELTDSIK